MYTLWYALMAEGDISEANKQGNVINHLAEVLSFI